MGIFSKDRQEPPSTDLRDSRETSGSQNPGEYKNEGIKEKISNKLLGTAEERAAKKIEKSQREAERRVESIAKIAHKTAESRARVEKIEGETKAIENLAKSRSEEVDLKKRNTEARQLVNKIEREHPTTKVGKAFKTIRDIPERAAKVREQVGVIGGLGGVPASQRRAAPSQSGSSSIVDMFSGIVAPAPAAVAAEEKPTQFRVSVKDGNVVVKPVVKKVRAVAPQQSAYGNYLNLLSGSTGPSTARAPQHINLLTNTFQSRSVPAQRTRAPTAARAVKRSRAPKTPQLGIGHLGLLYNTANLNGRKKKKKGGFDFWL